MNIIQMLFDMKYEKEELNKSNKIKCWHITKDKNKDILSLPLNKIKIW